MVIPKLSPMTELKKKLDSTFGVILVNMNIGKKCHFLITLRKFFKIIFFYR